MVKEDNINHKGLINLKGNIILKVHPTINGKGSSKILLNNFKVEAAVQFSPGFDSGVKLPTHEGKATNEDALALILRKMDGIEENRKAMAQHYKSLEGQFTQMSQQQKTMEYQMGQLATTVGHMQN
ncbi:hypothetical protein ACS0TY_013082 [Phlomoides rotata]